MNELLTKIRRMLAALVVGVVVLVAYVTWQSYQGRVLIVDGQRAGCDRGKLDRAANAEGWRTAETARRASGGAADLVAAARYDEIATGLEERSRIDCATAFPAPSLVPLGGR